MKKLSITLTLAALCVIGNASAMFGYLSRAGSRLTPTLRSAAPRYFSTSQTLRGIKPQAFSTSRFSSMQPKSPKVHTFATQRVGQPSLYQRAVELARRYYRPAAAVGVGALGTKYLTSKTPDMNIFRPSVALAEEFDLYEKDFQYLTNKFQSNPGLVWSVVYTTQYGALGEQLRENNDATEENKKRYAKLSQTVIKHLYQLKGVPLRHLIDETEIETTLAEGLPNINLVKELDLNKRIYIPKIIIDLYKSDKQKTLKLIDKIERRHRGNDKKDIRARALLNMVREITKKDFPENDGYIVYTQSWIPWGWFGL